MSTICRVSKVLPCVLCVATLAMNSHNESNGQGTISQGFYLMPRTPRSLCPRKIGKTLPTAAILIAKFVRLGSCKLSEQLVVCFWHPKKMSWEKNMEKKLKGKDHQKTSILKCCIGFRHCNLCIASQDEFVLSEV